MSKAQPREDTSVSISATRDRFLIQWGPLYHRVEGAPIAPQLPQLVEVRRPRIRAFSRMATPS